jgi:hypothetical protein
VAVIASFIAGYHVSDNSWERKAAEYKLQLEKEKADVLQQIRGKEQKTNEKIIWQQGVSQAQESASNRNFELVIDRLRTDTAGSDDSVSADSTTRPAASSSCECGVRSESRRAFRELRKEISILMHDCEITSIKYNELYERALAQQSLK